MNYWEIALTVGGSPLALVEAIKQILFVVVVGAIVFLLIAFQFLKLHELYGSDDSDAYKHQVNCLSCGARISAEADTCDYCGEPINR